MADAPGTTDDPVEGRPLPDDAVLELLRGWLPHQRWFPAKGTSGAIDRVAVIELADPLGEAEVRLELLRLTEEVGRLAAKLDQLALPLGVEGPYGLSARLASPGNDYGAPPPGVDVHAVGSSGFNTLVPPGGGSRAP